MSEVANINVEEDIEIGADKLTEMVSCTFTIEQKNALITRAKADGRSLSSLIRLICTKFLNE